MKVLVTGGTGFIGSHLVERLRRRGDNVVCVAKDRMNALSLESLGVEIVLGDLNNGLGWEAILDGVDYIYHVAGMTRARRPKDFYDGNYLATRRLVELALHICRNLKRFVCISSQAAVGPSLDGRPVTEETPYHPITHYGKSKMLGEIEVSKVSDRLPVTIVRPAAVYGPRDRDWYKYFMIVKRGFQPLMGFGKKLLSLIYSQDLVDGIIAAAEHPRAAGEAYFLASEEYYTAQDVGQVIARILKRNPICVRIPHAVVHAIGAISEGFGKITGKPIFFNRDKVKDTVQSAWICSVEKAKSHFGFCHQISLDDGMLNTYRWYCEHGWL